MFLLSSLTFGNPLALLGLLSLPGIWLLLKIYMENDGLLKINDQNILLTPLGEHFSPQIANVFDVYNDQEFYKKAI